ncbi:heme biosynthesis protein HemY [Paracoccus sp. p4-l81]|uniref:heme biosynthesis protein HemY n=1 Tax=Paracoccus sp. p4-l81 TaxID=3342806 RepID=UPI0035BA34CD
MLGTILKAVLFVALVAVLALAVTNLSDAAAGVRIQIGQTEYLLGPVTAVIALLVTLFLIWLALKIAGMLSAFIRFLAGDATALNRYFDRRRRAKGYDALAQGMLAVASGEGRLAQAQAARADKYLNRPEVTRLLTAQAAEAAGDSRTAYDAYKAMLSDDRTRFVGVQGLMRHKLAEGDTATALLLAQKAYALKPRHADVQDTLLQLETKTGHWGAARKVLEDKVKDGRLPKDVYKRRDAVMALQEAREVFAEGATIEAREAAIAANRKSPDLIPAAVMAARTYLATGEGRNAARVLTKAWAAQPHPSLAAVFAEIVPDETPQARIKRFEQMLGTNPDHVETRLLRAELNLAAEDFPTARRVMKGLPDSHPTARVMTIMAAIERGEGADDAVVRGWLTRALTASRGPQWVCDDCQNVMADWAPTCDACGHFDTLTWREPKGAAQPIANGAEMLPLIVGAIEGPKPEPQPAPAPVVDGPRPGMIDDDPPAPEPAPRAAPVAVPVMTEPELRPGFTAPEPKAEPKPQPKPHPQPEPKPDDAPRPASPDMADSRSDRAAVKGVRDEPDVVDLARRAQEMG